MVTSPIMNLGYCSSVRRFCLSSLPGGGKPHLLQMANTELNTLSLDPVFSEPQQVVNAAAKMQLAITVSMLGRERSLASHDSCLNFKLQGSKNEYIDLWEYRARNNIWQELKGDQITNFKHWQISSRLSSHKFTKLLDIQYQESTLDGMPHNFQFQSSYMHRRLSGHT